MNLHLLKLFVTVAEVGSFSRAAESLWISQPAVSKGISELEHQLDLVLIERGPGGGRGGKGFRLTEAGASLLVHGRGIFALERAAIEDVRARVGVQRGSLTLGASTTVAAYWLPQYVAAFHKAWPDIVPKVLVGNTQWVSEQLLECRIDMALLEGHIDDERIRFDFWQHEEMVIVVPPGSALLQTEITAPALSLQNWILREQGSGTRQVTQSMLKANGITVQPWMEIAGNEAIARTVASGAGISLLPRVVVADLIALGALSELRFKPKNALNRPLFKAVLQNRAASPAARKMSELLTG